jgi:hypothetical protein
MTADHNNDNELNTLMKTWDMSSPAPGFETRIAARIMERRRHAAVLPWSPLKFAAATAIAAVIGIFLGVTMPVSDATAETTEMIEMLW